MLLSMLCRKTYSVQTYTHVCRQDNVDSVVADLAQAGVLQNTTVVAAPEGCGLGERYAALCSALSIGEQVRDEGGHSFVVLDDISCMVSCGLCLHAQYVPGECRYVHLSIEGCLKHPCL